MTCYDLDTEDVMYLIGISDNEIFLFAISAVSSWWRITFNLEKDSENSLYVAFCIVESDVSWVYVKCQEG